MQTVRCKAFCSFGISFSNTHLQLRLEDFQKNMSMFVFRTQGSGKFVYCCRNTREYTRIHENTREYTRKHENTREYTRIHENTREYTRIHENTREYTRIHTRNKKFVYFYRNIQSEYFLENFHRNAQNAYHWCTEIENLYIFIETYNVKNALGILVHAHKNTQ